MHLLREQLGAAVTLPHSESETVPCERAADVLVEGSRWPGLFLRQGWRDGKYEQCKHPVGVYISPWSTSSSPMKPVFSQQGGAGRKALAQQLWPSLLGRPGKALEQSKLPPCRPSFCSGYWTGERSILGLTDVLNPEMCGRHSAKHGGGTRPSPQRAQSAPSRPVSVPTAVLDLGSSSILHPSTGLSLSPLSWKYHLKQFLKARDYRWLWKA